MPSSSPKPVCVVAGVGPGNGEACARRFVEAGFAVALLARRTELIDRLASELPDARAYACDVADEAQLAEVFARISNDLGAVDALIYNAGSGVWGAIDEVTPAEFEAAWRTNAFGLFLTARAVIPAMTARSAGTIVVIGATASTRGVAGTAAFAPAKTAQRALAQSMARHLGARGIHVAYVVVDGVIAGPRARARFPGRGEDSFIDPEGIADMVLGLTRQPRSAWTFETDVRPFDEKW